MTFWRQGLALLAGGTSVLAYAPFELAPLALVSLAVLFALLGPCSPRQQADEGRARRALHGFSIGFAWGLGAMLAGVSWLYIALHRFGGMSMPLAAFAVLLFCAGMALHAGMAGALFATLRRGAPWRDAAVFAAVWLLSEWLRGWLFTGFPWLASGYSQSPPSPLAGFAPVLGVYGVGGLLALAAAWACQSVLGRRGGPLLAVLALLVAGAALRQVAWTEAVGAPVKLALLQTNIEQGLKWRPEMLQRWLDVNVAMLRDNPAEIVVLPETTLPLLVEYLPPGYLDELRRVAADNGGDVILGTFVRNEAGNIFNAAISLGRSAAGYYAKQHLVPFGEYSPPLFRWFYELVNIPMADQTRGPERQPPMLLAGQKVAVNICYEDAFGEELIRSLPEATLMLNISNLAWYGDSLAQPQHLQIARLRALETGRPMLRSTNTGMTALVMPDGAVEAVLPAFQAAALRVEVRGYQGLTPYARWGNGLAVGLAGLSLLICTRWRRR